MASASWPGSSRSCWSMLGVLFLIFQRWLAGRLVGLPAGARNGEEGGVDWGTTRPKTDERARKGRLPNFFYFPLHFLCVVTYLLFRHACNAGSETNVWVQEGGYEKKKGVRCLKKKNPFGSVGRRILSSRNLFTQTFQGQQTAAISLKYQLTNGFNYLVQQNEHIVKFTRTFSILKS